MAGIIREMRTIFTASANGLLSTVRGVRRSLQGVSRTSQETVRESSRSFSQMNDSVAAVSDTIDSLNDRRALDDLNRALRGSREHFEQTRQTVNDLEHEFDALGETNSFNRIDSSLNRVQQEMSRTGRVTQRSLSMIERELNNIDDVLDNLGDGGTFDEVRDSIRGAEIQFKALKRAADDVDFERKFRQLPDHLKDFGREVNTSRREIRRMTVQGTQSLDEMADAAVKSSVALNRITSVTSTGKDAIKTIQGLSSATKETQLAILGLNRDGTVKISTEETTQRLARFKDELHQSKRELEALRDAGDFGSYEAGMRVVEQKLRDVDRAMMAASRGGRAYQAMITELGVNTSDAANQAAIQMEAYKDRFIRSVDMMNARSNQSKKMMDILPEVSHFQRADRFFLGIGNRLEDIAKKGSAASIALRMLGPNASMKDLNDRVMLINQGLMRMNQLSLGMGIAFGGFTIGMLKLSDAVDGRLAPAFKEFKETWLDALTPFAQVWTDFALLVVKAGTKVGEFVQKVNELNPAISEMAGMFLYLFTGLSVILAPMAIGIGRAEGMRAAFTSVFMLVKPFVLGFLRIAAVASILAGAMVAVGGVFIKLWKNSENLRAAMMSLWETLKEAGATIAAPFVKAFKMIGEEVTKLLNKMVGSDAQNMASFWQIIGDKIAVGVNKISSAIKPVAERIASVVNAFVEWEGFLPVIAGLTAAFVTYKTTVLGVAAAVKAWNLIQKASLAIMGLSRAAMIAYTFAGGGLQGILAILTVAQNALNLSMMANPIGLIIAAIVGLGVAFVVAYKKSETFRNFVNKLWNKIKTGGSAVLNFLKNNWPVILAIITGPIGLAVYAVVKYWDQIKSATITAFNAVVSFFKQWGPLMLAALGGPLGLAVYAVVKNWDSIKSSTISIFNAVKDAIVNALTKAKDLAVGIAKNFVTNVKNDWNNLKNNTISIYNSVKDFIVAAFNWIKDNATKIVQNYINNVKNNWNALKSSTVTIYNEIKTFLSNLWTSLKDNAVKVAQALWNGVKSQWNALKSGTINIFNSVRKFLSDLWSGIKNNVTKLASSAKDGVVNAWTSLRNRTTEMFQSIKTKVNSVFDDIVSGAKKLPGRIGDGIKAMAGGVKKGVTSFANTLVGAMGKGLNGAISGVNWVLKKIDVKEIPKWDVPKYKPGTDGHPEDGPAWVGDGYKPELMLRPDGTAALSPNKPTLVNMEKGTKVLSGEKTAQFKRSITAPMYKKGNVIGDAAKAVGNWAKDTGGQVVDKGQELYEHAKDKTVKTAGKAKDLALDVWDYMSDPEGLMKKVFGKFIPDLPKLGSAAGDILTGGVKKVKDSTVGFIKSKLDEYMSFSGGGGDGSTVGPGSGYGGMHPYVEAWYKKLKDKFGPTKFMGGYNNRNVRGGSSKSMHAYGRAFDIGGSAKTMSQIAEWARKHINNLQYAIYNRRIAGPGMGKPWRHYSGVNPHTDHVHLDFMAQGGGGAGGKSGKGAEAWRGTILKAAAKMKEKVTPAEVNGIIAQIHRESKGNERITQDPRVNDINARTGNLAKGLLQYVPSTFRAYALPSNRNIMSGYDQLLAFFNNTTWRRDLPYGRRGWGPRGKRKYERGGIINYEHDATVGEGGKREVIIPLEQFRARALQLFRYVGEQLGFDMDTLMDGRLSLSSLLQGLTNNAVSAITTPVPSFAAADYANTTNLVKNYPANEKPSQTPERDSQDDKPILVELNIDGKSFAKATYKARKEYDSKQDDVKKRF